MLKFVISQDQQHCWQTDGLIMDYNEHEIWFKNKDGEKALFARYEDPENTHLVLGDYQSWLDENYDAMYERTFLFVPNDMYEFIWGALEDEWRSIHLGITT